jgi:tetratricopeptide (TPR) repeat protein
MKLHTELFQLRLLLLAELEEQGCLLYRDLHAIEVDLTAGELILSLVRGGNSIFPHINSFCERHGLTVEQWSCEGDAFPLGFAERDGLPDEIKPRCPAPPPPGGGSENRARKREYAAAVRQVFNSLPGGTVYLHAGRVAWSMGRPDLALPWFTYAAQATASDEVRAQAQLWRGVCLHLQSGTLDRTTLGRACRAYRQVLELGGDRFLAYLNLGKLSLLLGWHDRARKSLRRALQLRAKDREIHFLLSLAD